MTTSRPSTANVALGWIPKCTPEAMRPNTSLKPWLLAENHVENLSFSIVSLCGSSPPTSERSKGHGEGLHGGERHGRFHEH